MFHLNLLVDRFDDFVSNLTWNTYIIRPIWQILLRWLEHVGSTTRRFQLEHFFWRRLAPDATSKTSCGSIQLGQWDQSGAITWLIYRPFSHSSVSYGWFKNIRNEITMVLIIIYVKVKLLVLCTFLPLKSLRRTNQFKLCLIRLMWRGWRYLWTFPRAVPCQNDSKCFFNEMSSTQKHCPRRPLYWHSFFSSKNDT